jgi:hypothetical protein
MKVWQAAHDLPQTGAPDRRPLEAMDVDFQSGRRPTDSGRIKT